MKNSAGTETSGSWCDSFLEVLGPAIATKTSLRDPFLGKLLYLLSVNAGVVSLLMFNDSFSDEGDLHILFKGWNAMLSGSKGPAVPLNIFPTMFKEVLVKFTWYLLQLLPTF